MKRILEPELIEDDALALACARADLAEANGSFVRFFGELAGGDFVGCALDLGCGPGTIVLRLAQAHPGGTVHGLDGSAAMIRLAEEARRAAPACADRVAFVRDLLPGPALPCPGNATTPS
jgi:SAM-dependent methyltransferase